MKSEKQPFWVRVCLGTLKNLASMLAWLLVVGVYFAGMIYCIEAGESPLAGVLYVFATGGISWAVSEAISKAKKQ